MANGYNPTSVIVSADPIAVAGIVTSRPISKEFGTTAGGALNLRVDLDVSAVTVVGSIVAKLQQRTSSGSYADLAGANATVTITAAGSYQLTQLTVRSADQPNLPLRKMLRVVLTTTNAGDLVTVDAVEVLQEL